MAAKKRRKARMKSGVEPGGIAPLTIGAAEIAKPLPEKEALRKEIEELRAGIAARSHKTGAIQAVHHYATLLNNAIKEAYWNFPCNISVTGIPEHVKGKEVQPAQVEVVVRT